MSEEEAFHHPTDRLYRPQLIDQMLVAVALFSLEGVWAAFSFYEQ